MAPGAERRTCDRADAGVAVLGNAAASRRPAITHRTIAVSAVQFRLAAEQHHLLEVKKSRFLAIALPCDGIDAALAALERVSDRAATHNCWAYRIGSAYRFSDDGEPAGTAGRPILAAIDGSALDHLLVVVTRWFGGIKLGAGGLQRAYAGVAAECLRLAPRKPVQVMTELQVSAGFEHLGLLHLLIDQFGADKLSEQHHAEGAELRLRLPLNQAAAFASSLRDGSRGRACAKVQAR